MQDISDELNIKYQKLKNYLRNLESVAVAFSGGVDSVFLLRTAADILGNKVLAITVSSYSFPERELKEAKEFCAKNGIKHIVAEFDELKIDGFAQNPKNRCYLCKRELFEKILKIAKENNMKAVVEGSNADDSKDYRPGSIAVCELGIKTPLKEAGLTKKEIRELSKKAGLESWNKQSFACLATRFPYGETITKEKLIMADKAEQFLIDSGFHQLRVRFHGLLARIEISPDEFDRITEKNMREKIYSTFREYGFSYITLDLKGYRTGSMNEVLSKEDTKNIENDR